MCKDVKLRVVEENIEEDIEEKIEEIDNKE